MPNAQIIKDVYAKCTEHKACYAKSDVYTKYTDNKECLY